MLMDLCLKNAALPGGAVIGDTASVNTEQSKKLILTVELFLLLQNRLLLPMRLLISAMFMTKKLKHFFNLDMSWFTSSGSTSTSS